MSKFILIFFILVLPFVFNSCKEEDDEPILSDQEYYEVNETYNVRCGDLYYTIFTYLQSATLTGTKNENITNLIIPETIIFNGNSYRVTKIKEAAFQRKTKLIKVVFPESLETIGERAFYDCTNLRNFILPSKLKEIGKAAFSQCVSLTSVKIPNSITTLNSSLFSYCSNLENVEIGSSVEVIGSAAFYKCKISFAKIPDKVVSIGSDAYDYCPLTTIILGESVKEIDQNFDHDNSGIREVLSFAKEAPWCHQSTFHGVSKATLHVPKGCKDNYLKISNNLGGSNYNYFGNIIDDL